MTDEERAAYRAGYRTGARDGWVMGVLWLIQRVGRLETREDAEKALREVDTLLRRLKDE